MASVRQRSRVRSLPRACAQTETLVSPLRAGGEGKPQGADDTICLEAGPGSCDAMAEALRDMWKVAPLPNPRLAAGPHARRAARVPGMRTRAHFFQRCWSEGVGGPECAGNLTKCVSAAALFGECARSAAARLATETDLLPARDVRCAAQKGELIDVHLQVWVGALT